VLREVDRPVNVLVGKNLGLLVAELSVLGVRRISLGGMLSALAYGALLHAAREILETGTFGFAGELDRARDLRALIDAPRART
jgi:2-methylisocitrate lyase-like PEP mutase family enzyme